MIENENRFFLPVTVYWEDTDAAGIVYYANYLKFMERGRSDLVRRAGIDQNALFSQSGLVFAVKRCLIDYIAPARLEDALDVTTEITKLGGASLEMRQVVRRGEEDLVTADVRLACINREGKPTRIPAEIKSIMSSLMANDDSLKHGIK